MTIETIETETQATSAGKEAGVDELSLADALGKVGLASIGAVSLAVETVEKLLQRLVARGEIDERKARRAFRELLQKRPHLPRPPHPVIAVGARNLASKADIQALEQRVAALAVRVELLNASAVAGTSEVTFEGAPGIATGGTLEGTPAGA